MPLPAACRRGLTPSNAFAYPLGSPAATRSHEARGFRAELIGRFSVWSPDLRVRNPLVDNLRRFARHLENAPPPRQEQLMATTRTPGITVLTDGHDSSTSDTSG